MTIENFEVNAPATPAIADDTKLVADVEQFLYFHRSADLTAEVLQVRLLLAIYKVLKSTSHSVSSDGG
jgi:hypothetical protein